MNHERLRISREILLNSMTLICPYRK